MSTQDAPTSSEIKPLSDYKPNEWAQFIRDIDEQIQHLTQDNIISKHLLKTLNKLKKQVELYDQASESLTVPMRCKKMDKMLSLILSSFSSSKNCKKSLFLRACFIIISNVIAEMLVGMVGNEASDVIMSAYKSVPHFRAILSRTELSTVPLGIEPLFKLMNAKNEILTYEATRRLSKVQLSPPFHLVVMDNFLGVILKTIENYSKSVASLNSRMVWVLIVLVDYIHKTALNFKLDVNNSVKLVSSVFPTLCNLLSRLVSMFPALVDTSTHIDLLLMTGYCIASLCCSGDEVTNIIANSNINIVELIKFFIDSQEPLLMKCGWHVMNWLLNNDRCKLKFVQLKGEEKIYTELKKEPVFSRFIIYCTRKLSKLPEIRDQLIENGCIEPILFINIQGRDINVPKPVFVTSMTLSFMLESGDKYKDIIEKSNVNSQLLESVEYLFKNANKKDLQLFYSDLEDIKTLIQSKNYSVQCFGVWWILHLLLGEQLQHYNNHYAELIININIIPIIYDLIYRTTEEQYLLREIAIECLYVLAIKPVNRVALVEPDFWKIIMKIMHYQLSSAELFLYYLISDKNIYLYSSKEKIPKLFQTVADYICGHTDVEDYAKLFHYFYNISMNRICMYFLCEIIGKYEAESAHLNILDPLIKEMIQKLHFNYNTYKDQQLPTIDNPQEPFIFKIEPESQTIFSDW